MQATTAGVRSPVQQSLCPEATVSVLSSGPYNLPVPFSTTVSELPPEKLLTTDGFWERQSQFFMGVASGDDRVTTPQWVATYPLAAPKRGLELGLGVSGE